MISKPGAVGAIATGTTAGVVVTTEAVQPAVPLLQYPLGYFEIGSTLVVLPVQNAVVLITAVFSCMAVRRSIAGVMRRRKG
jgi:membrane protein implicated in regulation of membrane protease activity